MESMEEGFDETRKSFIYRTAQFNQSHQWSSNNSQGTNNEQMATKSIRLLVKLLGRYFHFY